MLSELLRTIDGRQLELEQFRPFEEGLLPRIREFYRVGMVYSSNAIEGFTYTLSETKVLLEDGLTAGGKPLQDMFAVLGHGKAYDFMFTLLASGRIEEKDILTFHSLLEGSLSNDSAPGEYRTNPAFITGSAYPVAGHQNIQREMDLLFQMIDKERDSFHPVEYAARIHKELVFIHPFADGNGRVARLLMNTSLIQKGFLPTIISPVLRSEYIAHLEKAHANDNDFMKFICRCELETQKEMLRLLTGSAAPHQSSSPNTRYRMR